MLFCLANGKTCAILKKKLEGFGTMDLKTPIKRYRKWLILLCCVAVVVALGFTVYALTLPGEQQLEATFPSGSLADWIPGTTMPVATLPLPTVPTTQPLLPPASDLTVQPEISLQPDAPVLQINTLRNKDFTKVNGYITCKTEESWLGVDVSVWQEDINWEKVAAAGVKFAMIRLAYRGWGKDGKLNVDPRAEANIQGAMAAGIKVGVYIYSQATNVQEAIEEAQFLLELLDGRPLEMPVVFDWEVPSNSEARTRNVKAKTIHACAMAFCGEIKAAGYQPMVYFNQWQGMAKYNLAELREAGIELWLAMYTKAMTYEYKVQMWQYTSKGKVPGIDGRVDLDLYFPYH